MKSGIAFVMASALVLVLVGTPALAAGPTGCLSGSVVDLQTKAPVAGVTVRAVSPSAVYTVMTDARGTFFFSGMAVDTYDLSFAAPHYNRLVVSGVALIVDHMVRMGLVALERSIRLRVYMTDREATAAFQPSHALDSYTLTSSRIEQTIGRTFW
jgi:Carboxypeptidase regulatory-like domain